MKTTMFFILILLGMTMGVRAQEQVAISRFQGERITGIDVSGAFDITIRQGNKTGATLKIPARYQDQLVFTLSADGELKIGFQGQISGKKADRFFAEIECSSLEEIDLSGACKLNGEGNFSARNLSVDLSGAAEASLEGDFLVEGKIEVDLSGASRFKANVEAANADIVLSGASRITLRGRADYGKMDMSGANNALMENFIFRELSVSASGASSVKVNATGKLNISGSGASKINYTGDAKLSVNTSGATSVSQF